jgi:hypothetical protein
VALAGMVTGNASALVLVRHSGIDRVEVADVLRGRWPELTISDLGSASPCWALSVEDAVELARARRGVEPLRIVVLGSVDVQREAMIAAARWMVAA